MNQANKAPEKAQASALSGGAQSDANVGETERLVSTLGGMALIGFGLSRRSLKGALLAAAGSGLVARGLSGRCAVYRQLDMSTAEESDREVKLSSAITIRKSPEEIYAFYRHFDNLPRFMAHVESVKFTGPKQTHWVIRAPGSIKLEWDAEMVDDLPGKLIRWRTLEDASIHHSGEIQFRKAPGDRGTEVSVQLEYRGMGSSLPAPFGKLIQTLTAPALHQELRRLKALLETGELPTIEGQPAGPAVTRTIAAAAKRVMGEGPAQPQVAVPQKGEARQPRPRPEARPHQWS